MRSSTIFLETLCAFTEIPQHGDGRTHLVQGWVKGKELGLPVGPPGLLILLFEVLRAHTLQEVFQPLVWLQAAEIEVTSSEGAFPRHITQHV